MTGGDDCTLLMRVIKSQILIFDFLVLMKSFRPKKSDGLTKIVILDQKIF